MSGLHHIQFTSPDTAVSVDIPGRLGPLPLPIPARHQLLLILEVLQSVLARDHHLLVADSQVRKY